MLAVPPCCCADNAMDDEVKSPDAFPVEANEALEFVVGAVWG